MHEYLNAFEYITTVSKIAARRANCAKFIHKCNYWLEAAASDTGNLSPCGPLLHCQKGIRKRWSKTSLCYISLKRRSSFFFFCTLSLIIRIFTVICDVLQHYYDKLFSPESWSSLLTSPLTENNGGACALSLSKNAINAQFIRRVTRRMFSRVLSCT